MLDWCESDDYTVLWLVLTPERLSASVFWCSVCVCVRVLFGMRKDLKLTYLDTLTRGCYANVCVSVNNTNAL